MKKPVLMIGILFMVIFLFQLKKLGYLEGRREKFNSPACASVLQAIKDKLPTYWKVSCKDKNLTLVSTIRDLSEAKADRMREVLYKDMANALVSLAKMSPLMNLQDIPYVKVSVISGSNQIDGLTTGTNLSQLSTLNNPTLIANHIKKTVGVKEKLEVAD